MDERCDRTDLLVDQCAHCKGHTLEGPNVVEIGFTAKAHYIGRCAIDASHQIQPGDVIGQTDHGWICTACVEEQQV